MFTFIDMYFQIMLNVTICHEIYKLTFVKCVPHFGEVKKLREAPLRKVNRYFRKQWVSRLYHSLVSEQRDSAFPLCFTLTMFTISQTTEEYRRIDFHTKVLQSLLIEVS